MRHPRWAKFYNYLHSQEPAFLVRSEGHQNSIRGICMRMKEIRYEFCHIRGTCIETVSFGIISQTFNVLQCQTRKAGARGVFNAGRFRPVTNVILAVNLREREIAPQLILRRQLPM